jgi:hypothetical protein
LPEFHSSVCAKVNTLVNLFPIRDVTQAFRLATQVS